MFLYLTVIEDPQQRDTFIQVNPATFSSVTVGRLMITQSKCRKAATITVMR